MSEVSLRDYYAAHAPAAPLWDFTPKLPPRPKNEADVNPPQPWERGGGELRYAMEYCAARDERERWELNKKIQTAVQWPFAWADEMIKARNAQTTEGANCGEVATTPQSTSSAAREPATPQKETL